MYFITTGAVISTLLVVLFVTENVSAEITTIRLHFRKGINQLNPRIQFLVCMDIISYEIKFLCRYFSVVLY